MKIKALFVFLTLFVSTQGLLAQEVKNDEKTKQELIGLSNL